MTQKKAKAGGDSHLKPLERKSVWRLERQDSLDSGEIRKEGPLIRGFEDACNLAPQFLQMSLPVQEKLVVTGS